MNSLKKFSDQDLFHTIIFELNAGFEKILQVVLTLHLNLSYRRKASKHIFKKLL